MAIVNIQYQENRWNKCVNVVLWILVYSFQIQFSCKIMPSFHMWGLQKLSFSLQWFCTISWASFRASTTKSLTVIPGSFLFFWNRSYLKSESKLQTSVLIWSQIFSIFFTVLPYIISERVGMSLTSFYYCSNVSVPRQVLQMQWIRAPSQLSSFRTFLEGSI